MKKPKPINHAERALASMRRLYRDAMQSNSSDKAASAVADMQLLGVQLAHEGMLTFLLDELDDEVLACFGIRRLP